jgi:hypothetical protein
MPLPEEQALRWIVSHYAQLRAEHGDAFRDPVLILPTNDFFPDAITPSPDGVETLLRRMLGYAPLADDLSVRLGFVAEEEAAGGGCGSAGCEKGSTTRLEESGRVVELADGYGLTLSVADVGHPILLTSSMSRGIGGLLLAVGGERIAPRDAGAMSELAAVVAGYGVLLTNGAYVVAKGCGGMRMHQGTHLSVAEHAVALALFVRLHGAKPGDARAAMETTQREEFADALRWVDSNIALVETLREDPASLADGVFTMAATQGVIARWLSGRRAKSTHALEPAAPTLVSKRPPRTEAERKRLEEARALVEKALATGDGE